MTRARARNPARRHRRAGARFGHRAASRARCASLANVASVLGPACGCARLPAQVRADRCESAQRGSYPSAHRNVNCASLGDLAAAESELAKPLQSSNCIGSRRCARRARAPATRTARTSAQPSKTCAPPIGSTPSRSGIQSHRYQLPRFRRHCCATRDIPRRHRRPRDEAISIVRRIRVEVGESRMARTIPLITIRAVRGAHRRGLRERPTGRPGRMARVPDRRRSARPIARRRTRTRRDWSRTMRPIRGRALRTASRRSNCASNAHPAARCRRSSAHSHLRRSIEETRAQLDANRLRDGSVVAEEFACPNRCARFSSSLPADTVVLAYFVGDAHSHAWLLTRQAAACRRCRARSACSAPVMRRSPDCAVARPRRRARTSSASVVRNSARRHRREPACWCWPTGRSTGCRSRRCRCRRRRDLLLDRFVLGYAPSLALALGKPAATGSHGDPRRRGIRPGVCRGRSPAAARARAATPAICAVLRRPRQQSHAAAILIARSQRGHEGLRIAATRFSCPGSTPPPTRVLQLPSRDLAVLHFATHAVARQDSPEQSALYLSEYSPDGALLPDSRLTASDIARSGLRADVVVLVRVAPPAMAARCAAKVCSGSPTDFSPTDRARSWPRCGRSKTPRRRAS